MKRLRAVIACVILSVACCATRSVSDQVELAGEGPVLAPIRHEKYWRGERELFGYNPQFTPNVVTFDPDNRPYIRTGKWRWGPKALATHPDAAVQTLDDNGRWTELDFQSAVRQMFTWWDGSFKVGPFAEERMVFDSDGDAYMIVEAIRSAIGRVMLLHSTDRGRTWKAYVLPMGHARLEYQDGHNQLTRPPVVLTYHDTILRMVVPAKKSDGTLSLPKAIVISNDSLLVPNHSGGGNSTATRGDLTHIVWPGATAVAEHEGTPQYAATYDRRTDKVTQPVLIGFGGKGKPDAHNLPAVCFDSRGYLHVVLGAHHNQFRYVRSLQPDNTAAGWTEPIAIGQPKQPRSGSYTYAAMVCDGDDTLHLVARWAGDGYRFRLVYMRKRQARPWEKHKVLVDPFRSMYSCWYHKLSLDRRGRLFLNYIFYANQFTEDEVQAYREKWPDEPISLPPGSRSKGGWWDGVQPHGPAMLISDDGGDAWRLAVTKDFLNGIPAADASRR